MPLIDIAVMAGTSTKELENTYLDRQVMISSKYSDMAVKTNSIADLGFNILNNKTSIKSEEVA